MAYDQSSAYQAPGRPYYPQNHQAPVQKPYGGYHAQQPQYDDYAQSYDHGYGYSEQQYGGYHGYGHDMNQQQGQYYQDQYYQDQSAGNGHGYGQYDQGYPPQDPPRQDPRQRGHAHQASGRPPPPNDAHGGSRHNGYGPQGRTYDPRYQQRPGRGAQPPPNGSKMQRPPPNQDHSGRPPPSRGQDPRSGHPSERSAYPPGQQGHDSRNGRRERGNERGAKGQPVSRRPLPQSNSDSHQAPSAARDPKKSAMEEWKAKERAKMHDAASKPKTIPQDNAFPTFPANQKEEKRSAGHGSKSARPSEDHPRPSTSSARSASRPGSSKSNQAQDLPYAQNSSGGQAFEQSHSTRGPQPFSPIQEQPIQDYQQQYMQEPAAYAYDDNAQQQWQADPQVNHEGYQAHGQPPMRNDSGHQGYGEQSRNRMPPQAPRGGPQQPYSRQPTAPQRVMSPPQMQPQGMRRPPPPQQAPSSSTQASSNGPMSVPPYGQANGHNPSVNPRAMPAPQAEPHIAYRAQETSHYPDSGASQPHTQNGYVAEQNSSHYTPQATHEHSTLDDVYDEYYGSNSPEVAAKPAPPKNREEEIEAEMPDFDSAAPGQTSSLHKRQQTDEKHANGAIANGATPPPSQNVNPSVQSLPVQTQQPYVHQQEAAAASQPEFRDMNQGQGSDGFVFGVPGEQVRPVRQDGGAQQMPPRQQPIGYRPVQSVPPEDMRRHQSPADGRQMQMPMRGGPPGDHPQGQRFHSGGRGPLPPQQQRSASTRPPMAQGGWSDPGQQRAPTAPPMRQDSRGAHPHGVPSNGGFPDQHRAPSAPPAQQDMRGMPLPGGPRNGAPPNQQQMQSRPPPQQQRPSDPDSLPHHPTPFRPGLADHGTPQPPKPAPVRNYDNRSSTTSSHARQPSMSDKPITKADLDQARADMEASPASPRLGLRYAKKLVEASHVLASEGGRLDAKTTQRNREKYLNEAYKRVKDLVRNAYPDAQFYMAECYGDGELGLTIDPKEAFALYQAAAKGGHAAAAFRTAVSCEIGPEDGGGTRKDHPKAVQWYRRAAALGDPAAMFKVGIMSLRGLLGVPRNVGEAFIWLKRAAERADKDNPHALHELATLHDPTNLDAETRAKVPADEPLSLSLFRRAADFGFKRSQYRLGQAYEYGLLGLEIDNRASIAWYTKAAAQGEHNAELALSGWYLTGADGMLDQSDMEAYLWARKAAQSEPPLAKAMFAMGYFTEQGIGCPKSLEEAKRWYGRAASFQFPRALERLEELRKGGKSSKAVQGKLTRDKKKDEENCAVM